MKNFKRLAPTITSFLLLFPFRLPISVLLIYAFNNIAQLAGKVVPDNVLCANVVITKLVYNLVLSSWFVYSIEFGSRKLMGRKAYDAPSSSARSEVGLYWWSICILLLTLSYIIYDGFATYEMFWAIIGKPNPSHL